MAIKDWPQKEQPRYKLLHSGARSLSDAELLAIFLRTGVAGKDAVHLARDLVAQFGSLRALLQADIKTFCRGEGLGEAKYVVLQAVLEMARRHFAESLQRGDSYASPQQVKAYLLAQLRDHAHEVFAILFLDNRHRLIKYEALFHGSIDQSAVYPREVVKKVLAHNAAAVIFAHNHPSGVAEPSESDVIITQQVKKAWALLDVRVLAQFIVGDNHVTSLAELGKI